MMRRLILLFVFLFIMFMRRNCSTLALPDILMLFCRSKAHILVCSCTSCIEDNLIKTTTEIITSTTETGSGYPMIKSYSISTTTASKMNTTDSRSAVFALDPTGLEANTANLEPIPVPIQKQPVNNTILLKQFKDNYHITIFNSSMPDDSEKKINKYLCEGETLNITCTSYFVIVFDDANFGRGRSDKTRCSAIFGIEIIHCDNHEQTLKVLNDKCHEQQQCFIPVNKAIFGNPCTGITEYLDVNYHCKRKVNHEETGPTGSPRITDHHYMTTNLINITQITVTSTTNSFQSGNDNLGRSAKDTEQELNIVGIVLGVVLALIFLLIGTLVFKRFSQSKQQNGIARTDEIEMNIESENQNQYDYSEVNAQSMGNNENQTSHVPNLQNQIENDYDVSSHVPLRSEIEPLTYDVHVSDNTYNVTETSDNEPKDDVNNTYDHFHEEQTEDQYDIAENKVMAATKCKSNEDLYY